MTRRWITRAGAVAAALGSVLAWAMVSAPAAQALCLPPCRNAQEGGILDSFFPGLLLGLVLGGLASWFAFRRGVQRGRDQSAGPGPDLP